ncbi:unnamed protein product [Adineta steineri]|uniref:Uncharacterized protein n=1 Tax=Adineta steineri TaxID=433720 RepID=A0A813M4R0_9BILA|nr:unnamed protein product [Adineta steineri]CAF4117718.1 unnamed protein product [Adineta steineri]
MFGSDDIRQLDHVLNTCSRALTQLSIVPKDEYNNDHIDKDRIRARVAQDVIADKITKNITKLTTNLNYMDDGFRYVRDEFFVSDDSKQFDYSVKAIQTVRPIVMTTDSYNSTLLFAWGVYNSKTHLKLNNYILEKRQEQNESIYLLRIFDSEEDSVPSYIYGKNPPMDVYYSTKLVLIHLLNGKGYLAKHKIDDMDYVMILTNDEHAAKIKAEQSAEVKETIDKKQNDL